MNWRNTPISKLWDQELKAAYIELAELDNYRLDRINTDKFKKKMLNQPEPQVNPAFLQLQNALLMEMKKRKINYA